MRIIVWIAVALAVLAAASALAIRLWPVDAARWHADPAAPGFAPGAHWAVFCPEPGSRYFSPGATDLSRFAGIALATPRTRLVAGSPEEGRMTFVTRSRLFGFPDFTTAALVGEGDGRRVCVYARQGIGEYDWGVNAARVRTWVQAFLGLNEPPDLD